MKSFQSFSYDILISEVVATPERERQAQILNQPQTDTPDSDTGMGGPISDTENKPGKPKKKARPGQETTKPRQQNPRVTSSDRTQQWQGPEQAPQQTKPQQTKPQQTGNKDLSKKVEKALNKAQRKQSEKAAAEAAKRTSKLSKLGTGLSRAAGIAGAGLEGAMAYQAEKEKGSGNLRAAGASASQVGGGIVGAELGAKLGATIGTAIAPGLGTGAGALIGGLGGYMAGSELGQKGFKTVAGANAAERRAMQVANRQRQEGGARYGLGNTTVSQKGKDIFMSSGAPGQRRTVQMAKTSVVTDPTTGKKDVGYLARKGGQVVYKRGQDPSSLAQTSTNPLERIGRSLFAGAYKQHDTAQAAKKLAQAQKSDIAYKKKLAS